MGYWSYQNTNYLCGNESAFQQKTANLNSQITEAIYQLHHAHLKQQHFNYLSLILHTQKDIADSLDLISRS